MKKYKILLGLLIFLVISLTFVRSVVSNRISTDGLVLGRMEEETAYYKTENLIYKEKIFTLSSLNTISQKADKLGFVNSKISFAVGSSLPIALR